jgi:hypothetical protein
MQGSGVQQRKRRQANVVMEFRQKRVAPVAWHTERGRPARIDDRFIRAHRGRGALLLTNLRLTAKNGAGDDPSGQARHMSPGDNHRERSTGRRHGWGQRSALHVSLRESLLRTARDGIDTHILTTAGMTGGPTLPSGLSNRFSLHPRRAGGLDKPFGWSVDMSVTSTGDGPSQAFPQRKRGCLPDANGQSTAMYRCQPPSNLLDIHRDRRRLSGM